jgi:hypothetical protein
MPASSAYLMVWEGGGNHMFFDVNISGIVGRGCPKWLGAAFSGAISLDEVLPIPSENTSCGGIG